VLKARRTRVALTCWCAGIPALFPLFAKAAENPASAGAIWNFDDWRPTITSADGRFSMSLRARLQLDTAGFDQADDVGTVTPGRDVEFKSLNSGALVRRAYLGIEGRAFRDLWYEYRMDFGGTGFSIADPIVHLARISYNADTSNGGPLVRFNAGLIKPIFTYDDATSSASLTFLERAAVVNVATSAFGGGATRLGAEVTLQQTGFLRSGDNLVVSGAFTGHVASRRPSEIPDDATGKGTYILGRVAYRLWSDGLSNIQVGGSMSRILTVGGAAAPGGARTLTLEDQPEIRVDGNSLISTSPLPAKGGALWGLEAAANFRNVYLAGEFYAFDIDRDTDCAGCVAAGDPKFSGWHVEGSWTLTGEAKLYQPNATNNGMATYANPRVTRPFALNGQSWGVWEVAARYSILDLNWQPGAAGTMCAGALAGCVRGGEQRIWTIGFNWYLSDNLRVLFDYMFVDVGKLDVSGVQAGQSLRVVGTRFQFTN
jgi:phosphate-selective porin OprO/OprP